MPRASPFLSCAHDIDFDRASLLLAEYGSVGSGARELAVLLGTVFPALSPRLGWQFDAIRGLADGGLQSPAERLSVVEWLKSSPSDLKDELAVRRGLRRIAWAEKARIALREILPGELGGEGIGVTAKELSHLGAALVEGSLFEAQVWVEHSFGVPLRADGRRAGLVVLGLGKLGGEELNPGSDVDVMFVYDTDDGESTLNLHDHFTHVVRRAVATLETPTEDGFAWRVDLRLRPEGSRGPLVNSLAAAERYYETWGRLWERAVLLRSRPIAGDMSLGAAFQTDIAEPFVYPRQVDLGVTRTMTELLERAQRELCTAPNRDLKLGLGGIREAEFFVQTLQLIWGGQDASLRVPSIFKALQSLTRRGLLTHRDAKALAEAYVVLRQTEHRIQFMTGAQTHLLFEDDASLGRLARSMRFKDAAELKHVLNRARQQVSRLFASLEPAAERPASRYHTTLSYLEADSPDAPEPGHGVLHDPDVFEHLQGLARRPDGLLGIVSRERHPALADEVLRAIAEAPDPRQAARYLRAFFDRFLSPGHYVAALAQDSQALLRFVNEVGSSAIVGDAVVSQPDIADLILFGAPAVSELLDSVRQEIDRNLALVHRAADPEENRDALIGVLRRARQRAMVTVADADLAGIINTRDATRTLSALADELLDRAVCHELGVSPRGLAVIAVGKLGGCEIGYGSDLDVLFVFEPEAAPAGRSAEEHFARVAQRIIRLLSEFHPAGRGYELDVRLRPSGAHGLLVTSLPAFARYHQVPLEDREMPEPPEGAVASSAHWERQALLRARVSAGDRELGLRVLRIAEVAAYERGAPDVRELHRLRLRMQHELSRERLGRYDVKLGYGGLLDVEFTVQWLQMRHGRDARVRTPDTGDAIQALFGCGYLSKPAHEVLSSAYRFLRRLEQRLHVLHGTATSEIDPERGGVSELARRMGLHDSPQETAKDALIERYLSVTRAVRRSYLGVLGLPSETQNVDAGRRL